MGEGHRSSQTRGTIVDGFEVALEDLRDSAKRLSHAAEVVAEVRDKVKGMDSHAEE
jgi:hypothetical protein